MPVGRSTTVGGPARARLARTINFPIKLDRDGVEIRDDEQDFDEDEDDEDEFDVEQVDGVDRTDNRSGCRCLSGGESAHMAKNDGSNLKSGTVEADRRRRRRLLAKRNGKCGR